MVNQSKWRAQARTLRWRRRHPAVVGRPSTQEGASAVAMARAAAPEEGGPDPEEVLALVEKRMFANRLWHHGGIVLLAYDA